MDQLGRCLRQLSPAIGYGTACNRLAGGSPGCDCASPLAVEPQLCKRNPRLLALASRLRLRRYDRWFTLGDHPYNAVFEAPYLSGFCLRLTLVNLYSAWIYFQNWGWQLW